MRPMIQPTNAAPTAEGIIGDSPATRRQRWVVSESATSMIEAFDAGVVASLTIASCPALEMPPEIQKLKRPLHLEIYNSTMATWGSNSALTRDDHPVLTGVFLVKVFNIKDGLPEGLLSPRFPPSLCVVQIAGGDLQALVSNSADEDIIETKWPPKMFVFTIEQTPLQAFPGTNISTVPPQVFFSPVGSTLLCLNDNPIASLPSSPSVQESSGSVVTVHLRNTQIRQIPSWPSSAYTTTPPSRRFFAHGSPLCSADSPSLPSFVECTTTTTTVQFPMGEFEAKRQARGR